ncbi:MAG TPA: serine hydrolase domain-containing protein, partial [Polyangiaceae bacterium]|nr:serine hydrolase domain-containing protein [Polyangiaceae bacterium]
MIAKGNRLGRASSCRADRRGSPALPPHHANRRRTLQEKKELRAVDFSIPRSSLQRKAERTMSLERERTMISAATTAARLGRLHEVMTRYVKSGAVPGLVILVSERGEPQVDTIGTMGVGVTAPIRRDTIFRIASMTKPITAAAAMILVEESKLHLDEAVDRLLPELANRRVLRRVDGALDDTVPARRAITVRDLLTFRMGFGLLWGPQDAHPIQRAANDLQLVAFGPPQPREQPPPDEWLRRFATLPLMHQPGEAWLYNTGFEVLGVLIARAAGQPLEAFMRERIFEPLGMNDTAFSVPSSKIDRLPPSYML